MTSSTSLNDQKAEFLLAIANPQRLRVLELLGDREMSVGRLVGAIGISQSALSQHLAKLREANLVSTRRDAQTIYYSIKSDRVRVTLTMLNEMFSIEASTARKTG